MRYLRALCRIIIGVVLIISGYFKAVDPIGTELKIKEYLNVFHIGFLKATALPLGILLCAIEFLVGVCILKGLRMKLFTKIALGLILFFSIVTLLNYTVLPVSDCGCFGDIIKLTAFETFLKNIILLPLIFFSLSPKRKMQTNCNAQMGKYLYHSLSRLHIGYIDLFTYNSSPARLWELQAWNRPCGTEPY